MRRRRLLATSAGLVGLAGCITDPGRSCRGAAVRLSLSPPADRDDEGGTPGEPLVLDSRALSTAADAVVETAVEGEHVENCVVWDGDPGPSVGLREVGERLEAHLGVDLAGRRRPLQSDARRDETRYRLVLEFDRRR